MPHDPALVAETGAWLRKAASDIRAASVDLASTPPLTEDVVFHAQQAAEKVLKKFRYPGDLEESERTEAEEALAVAREVFEGVLERLPAETWPPRG